STLSTLAAAVECARVLPVIQELAATGVPVSIDTTRAEVAAAALEAGAGAVNDVSRGLEDPGMAKVVPAAGCPWVLMHWRGHSRDMQRLAHRPLRRRVTLTSANSCGI